MKFKSDEFMKNLEIEKEKAQLQKQADALESEKKPSILKTTQYFDDEPAIIDIQQDHPQELKDILLDGDNGQSNKRKYIILSISLIILFILTIIIIRLISYNDDDKLFIKPKQIKQEKILKTIDSNDQYEMLIKKNIKQTTKQKVNSKKIINSKVDLPKIENKKLPVKKIETTKIDVFGMEFFPKAQSKPIIKPQIKSTVVKSKKNPIKKVVTKTIIHKNILKKHLKKITGNYIQVGAFIKQPGILLINNIKKLKYPYILHKMTIKKKIYTKVLIGPYKNSKDISKVIKKIKKNLKVPSAYTLRLK
jgi:DedD protein